MDFENDKYFARMKATTMIANGLKLPPHKFGLSTHVCGNPVAKATALGTPHPQRFRVIPGFECTVCGWLCTLDERRAMIDQHLTPTEKT